MGIKGFIGDCGCRWSPIRGGRWPSVTFSSASIEDDGRWRAVEGVAFFWRRIISTVDVVWRSGRGRIGWIRIMIGIWCKDCTTSTRSRWCGKNCWFLARIWGCRWWHHDDEQLSLVSYLPIKKGKYMHMHAQRGSFLHVRYQYSWLVGPPGANDRRLNLYCRIRKVHHQTLWGLWGWKTAFQTLNWVTKINVVKMTIL